MREVRGGIEELRGERGREDIGAGEEREKKNRERW